MLPVCDLVDLYILDYKFVGAGLPNVDFCHEMSGQYGCAAKPMDFVLVEA